MPPDTGTWERLATAALLGTERAGVYTSDLKAIPAIHSLLESRPTEANDAALLTAAAVLSVYLRAGREMPLATTAPLEPAAVEQSTVAGQRVEGYLVRMLTGEQR